MGYRSVGKLENFGREEPLLAAQRRTVDRVGSLLHERVRVHTPIAKPPPGHEAEWLAARRRLPGTLRESWKVGEVMIEGSRMTIPVLTHDPVAPHVEWPTRPHLIFPRGWSSNVDTRRPEQPMLRFWTKTGETVFAWIVHHPGTQGSYMMTTALSEVALMWQEIGAEEMRRWADEQARLVTA